VQLPESGIDVDELRATMQRYAADDVDFRHGRGWSLVYDSPSWHRELIRETAARFADENALSHSAFPSAARFESAVIAMVASVVAPRTTCYGIFTSGGTESTLVAMKGYRDASDGSKRSLVVPATAHPAYGKAAAYLGLEVKTVPVTAAGAVDPHAVAGAIDEHSLAVGLSAPCYPFGIVDPVTDIAALAAERGVGVHVDAALGGMFLPFLDAAGREPLPFGVDVAGVTSVTVDLHKYGYAAKGASVVLFADERLRHAAYHVSLGWPGGAYASSGVLGTRSVGAAAAAFVSLAALGRAGYRTLVRDVMNTTTAMQARMSGEFGLQVIGDPTMSVFAVTASEARIARLAQGLQQRGWWIDVQANPPSLHFIVFPRHAAVIDQFFDDLAAAGSAREPGGGASAPLASYGVMVRDSAPVTEAALWEHLDARFDTPHRP
jgi:glutamate/tyrosine decarboxylase-like PLP-dependent enzyme